MNFNKKLISEIIDQERRLVHRIKQTRKYLFTSYLVNIILAICIIFLELINLYGHPICQ